MAVQDCAALHVEPEPAPPEELLATRLLVLTTAKGSLHLEVPTGLDRIVGSETGASQ
jgi:hypothetical protein